MRTANTPEANGRARRSRVRTRHRRRSQFSEREAGGFIRLKVPLLNEKKSCSHPSIKLFSERKMRLEAKNAKSLNPKVVSGYRPETFDRRGYREHRKKSQRK